MYIRTPDEVYTIMQSSLLARDMWWTDIYDEEVMSEVRRSLAV